MAKTKVTFPDGTPLDTLESLPPRKRRRPFPITGHHAVVAAAIAAAKAPRAVKKRKPKAAAAAAGAAKGSAKKKAKVDPNAPKRQARYRTKCPIAINERKERVMSQRMFMVDRLDASLGDDRQEIFKVAGSTGNIYTVTIAQQLSCDCPDEAKGNLPCKHVIFVFLKVLKVDVSSDVWYQKALLPDELASVLSAKANASAIAPKAARKAFRKAGGADVSDDEDDAAGPSAEVDNTGKRLSAIGDDCPVCIEEMTEADHKSNLLMFDTTGCGMPIHRECFGVWSQSSMKKGQVVSCVFCRANWPAPAAGSQNPTAVPTTTSGGYQNMADNLGISRTRDISTYYQGPMRGQRRYTGDVQDRYRNDDEEVGPELNPFISRADRIAMAELYEHEDEDWDGGYGSSQV